MSHILATRRRRRQIATRSRSMKVSAARIEANRFKNWTHQIVRAPATAYVNLGGRGANLSRLASKAFRKPDSSGRTSGWSRASASSSMKNDASIALSCSRTTRHAGWLPRSGYCSESRLSRFSPMAAPPTPISAATEQQQHDNNNQDQFHQNSPLTPTSVRRAPRIQRRRQAIVPAPAISPNLHSGM